MIHRIFILFLVFAPPLYAEEAPRPLARAFEAMERQEWDVALTLAAQDGQTARDVIEWHLHRAQRGKASDAVNFLARNPDWPGLPYFKKRSERSFLEATPELIRQFFADHPPQTSEGAFAYARALEAAGNSKRAREVIQNAWLKYKMPKPIFEQIQSHYGKNVRKYTRARLYEMMWQEARTDTAMILPYVSTDNQHMRNTYFALLDGKNGVTSMLSKLPSELRSHPLITYARFNWRMKTGKRDSAIELMLKASASENSLGRPSKWGPDRRNIVRDLLFDQKYKTAYAIASAHHLKEGRDYADLEWLSGYTALRHRNAPETAQLHFERFLFSVDTPISLGRAYYWIGRAYEKQGASSNAQKAYAQGAEYQTSFYGLLSAEKISAPFPYKFNPPAPIPDWRGAPFLNSSVFKAAVLLFAAGETVLAERFITHLSETLSDREILQMTDFLEELKRPHELVMVGKRKASEGKDFTRAYYALHPMMHENHQVPSQLALAIARRESEFDPHVVSPVGALGIMQVMPKTAREMAGNLQVKYSRSRMLNDWKYNALIGTTYLKELSDRYQSNPVLVSIAYNAGPTRADRWMRLLGDPRRKDIDIIDWIELIPFSETRNYVMRTAESLPIYRERLNLDPLPVPFSQYLKGARF